MTLCPIALAVGCKKCPAFKICPAKGLIGDMPPAPAPTPEVKTKATTGAKPRSAASRKKRR